MYDISSITIKGDFVEMLVMHDHNEENLLLRIKAFVNKSHRSESDFPDQLQQILSLLYILPEQSGLSPFFSFETGISFPFISMSAFSKEQSIFCPPPEF